MRGQVDAEPGPQPGEPTGKRDESPAPSLADQPRPAQSLAATLLLKPAKPGGARRLLQGRRDELLTVAQVARQLGVCNATVYKLCEAGALEHVRIVNLIRFEASAVERFIKSRKR